MCKGVEARRRGKGKADTREGKRRVVVGSGSFIPSSGSGASLTFWFLRYDRFFFSFSGDEVVVFLRTPSPFCLDLASIFASRCVSKSSTRDVPFSCSRPRFCSHRPHNSASHSSKYAPLLSRQHCNLNSLQVLFALWGGRITPPHRALDRAREEVGDRQHFLLENFGNESSPKTLSCPTERGPSGRDLVRGETGRDG